MKNSMMKPQTISVKMKCMFIFWRKRLWISRKNRIGKLQAETGAEEYRLQETERDLEAAVKEKERQQEIETNLRVELKQNKEFLALEEQEKILARLKEEEKTYLLEKRELLSSVKKSLKKSGSASGNQRCG